MPRLNYNHLRYFWAVAHHGNLTRTAKELHVSQSALSLQIKKLEEQLGHKLFERRGKQLQLTEAGHLALSHADVIFASGDELLSSLQQHQHASKRLRVGALSTLSRNFQIQFLGPLLNREDTSLSLRSGTLTELLALLEAHELDVVLTNQLPLRSDANPWIIRTIAEQPVELIRHTDRVIDHQSLVDTLRQQPLIVPSIETSIRAAFDAYVDLHNIQPRIVAEVDDMALLRLLTRRDQGIAVIPPIVVQDEIHSGELVEICALPGVHEVFWAVTLTRHFPNPQLDAAFAESESMDEAIQPLTDPSN